MTARTDPSSQARETQRIDKWLWHARFARTRTAAQRLAVSGQVRINRQRVTSASRSVKPGDVLTLVVGRTVRVVEVTAIASRRGAADAARELYEDRTPAITVSSPRSGKSPAQNHGGGTGGSGIHSEGRPDKHGRKRILALKRKQF
jgi:ribosome-associated heat shock protein Hsp15